MAQDVKSEECTGKWDVTHIPEELQTVSMTGIVLSSSSHDDGLFFSSGCADVGTVDSLIISKL